MKLVFQHLRETRNIGDRWCSPYDWFDWPHDAVARDIRVAGPSYDVGVYGGGKIFGGLSRFAGIARSRNTLHIAWGVSTVQSFPLSVKYYRASRLCTVVGTRDWGDRRFQWVPCASCMAPHFNVPDKPEHDVVFYFHGGKTTEQGIEIPNSIPSLSNNATSLDEALTFIASGRTVVSNSYHGVYWALLMGRRVLCIPFSKKFSAYRLPPAYATPRNWLKNLNSAVAQPESLDLSRKATTDFKTRVERMIDLRNGD